MTQNLLVKVALKAFHHKQQYVYFAYFKSLGLFEDFLLIVVSMKRFLIILSFFGQLGPNCSKSHFSDGIWRPESTKAGDAIGEKSMAQLLKQKTKIG